MKQLIYCWLLIGWAWQARADHITGGEMYYTYVGSSNGLNTYNVTMKFYMRCNSGRTFANPTIVSVFDKGTNQRIRDILVPLGLEDRISLVNNDPCISNPPTVCFDVAYYYFAVSVPVNSDGFLVVGQVNFRIAGIANVAAAGNIGATYTGEIPGALGIGAAQANNSARFTASDLVVVCANNPFTYSFEAQDPDGDQLRYSFCDAYQTGTGGGFNNQAPPSQPPYPLVPYAPGFSGNSPLGASVRIDPNTGLITGVAPGAGVYVVTVCVEEIRNGQVIATQRKDIQINITGCSLAAAVLPGEYQLCGNTNELLLENASTSSLINSYLWQIVNAQGVTIASRTDPSFTYNFADTGLYRVRLYTNRGETCPDSAEAPVRVYPGFLPDFDISGNCIGRPTQFTDLTTTVYGSVVGWRWNFGEPSVFSDTSRLRNPTYTYPAVGMKHVEMEAFNANGCRTLVRKDWEITLRPPVRLAFRDTLICPPDNLRLQAFNNATFSWTGPAIVSGAATSSPVVAPLATSRYIVQMNEGGCLNTDSVIVRVTDRVLLQTTPDTTVCRGDTIRLRAQGNGLKFIWQPAESLDNPTAASPRALTAITTTYTVQAFISGCSATQQFNVKSVPYPLADAGRDTTICFGESVQLRGSTDGVRVQWLPAATLTGAASLTPLARPSATTQYLLQAFGNQGCPKPGLDSVIVTVRPPIGLQVTRDTSVVVGQPLQLNVTGGVRYEWTPPLGPSPFTAANPVVQYSEPSDRLVYNVRAFDEAGCFEDATVVVRVFAKGPAIYVPNAFTPNGDGLNDVLRPVLAGMKELRFFRVYNRLGQEVFSTSRIGVGWDGRINGIPQASAAFVWMAQAVDYDGQVHTARGVSTLIR